MLPSRKLTAFGFCFIIFYVQTSAVELSTATPETGSVNNSKENPKIKVSVRSGQDEIGQINQSKDGNDAVPAISNSRNVDAENVSSMNETRKDGTPVAAISTLHESTKQLNQSKDVTDILPVIPNEEHIDVGNIVGGNKRIENGELVSAISKILDLFKPVNQSEDLKDVSNKDARDASDLTGRSEIHAPTAVVSRIEDKTGSVNQREDVSDIVPVINNNIDIDTVKSVHANETGGDGLPVAAISVIDSAKPVNQSKDIDNILPVVTKETEKGNVVDINQGNTQEPVNQAKDTNLLVPVEVNITNVIDIPDDGNKQINVTVPPPLVAIDNKVQPESDVPFVDLNIKFNSIGTEFCSEKSRCNSTTPFKTCACDRLCGLFEDCCEDAEIVRDVNLDLNQFTCTLVDGLPGDRDGMMFVSKCPPIWNDDVTKRLCEEGTKSDVFTRIPVSDKTEYGFIYKNRYCAHCNNVYKYKFWKASMKCVDGTGELDITDTENCELSYKVPAKFETSRKCKTLSNIISTCPASYTGDEIKEKCTKGFYSVVYTDVSDQYRNKYCAFCNGVNVRNLYCEPQLFLSREQSVIPPKIYSFRLIVDFNSKWEKLNGQFRKPFNECSDNEIYDPFAKTCREIFCPPSTKPVQGNCAPIPENMETNNGIARNCTLTKIKQDEFEYRNDSDAILFRDIVFNDTEYWENGSDIFVCLEKLNLSSTENVQRTVLYQFNQVESYISFVGLIVSIIASLITLSVYIVFPQLLNTPGKNVICLIISLVVSQVLFLVAAEVADLHRVCTVFAVLMHYFFLCAFCWMNVIAFDLWLTFSHNFVSQRHISARSKRFYSYSLYAWCLPVLIVGAAITLDCVNLDGTDLESFIPHYGEAVCWINSSNALLLFFAGPLAVFKLFDFVSFGFTAYHITKAKAQGAFVRKGASTSSFLINLRLSLVMGLTWAFAFVANFTNNSIMWYFFIICNTLQGLFIALSFLCTRKVLKLIREKCSKYSSQSSGTQMTTRPSYKSSD